MNDSRIKELAIEYGTTEMVETDIKITRFDDGEFWVDIIDMGDYWDSQITMKNYGVTSSMFGWLKHQPVDNSDWDFDDFLELVIANKDDYESIYEKQYVEEVTYESSNVSKD